MQGEKNILVTSRYGGRVRGHNGPVVFLSNKLLEEDNRAKHWQVEEKMVLFVVRLWSLSSSGRHDQRALKATLYGHENL
ncbi:hypothetical protein AAZX31_05G102200 [Glycine max]|nr:hypothetical protein JHK87_012515 [Glycine soja]